MAARVPTITPTVVGLDPEGEARLARLRRLAWLMDRSIPLGPWRVGLDPLIGLIPGLGDWVGAIISIWIIYQAARLGVPSKVLARMGVNVLVEAVVGAVPVLGDVFDAAWKANHRNLGLVERHLGEAGGVLVQPRSMRRLVTAFVIAVVLFLILLTALVIVVVRWAWGLLG